jgi:hypothetical protein
MEEQYIKLKKDLSNLISNFSSSDTIYHFQKYITKWNMFWSEKENIINMCNLENVNTSLDIGTGIGILPYQLLQKGIQAKGTDVLVSDNQFHNDVILGFEKARTVVGIDTSHLVVLPQKSLNLSSNYNLITASRTTFDNHPLFDWNYFVDDAMNYCDQLFIKTNIKSKDPCPFPPRLVNMCYLELTHTSSLPETVYNKNWCLHITKEK